MSRAADGEQSGKALYLRSDDRAHTLCYFEAIHRSNRRVRSRGREQSECRGATLDRLGHPVHAGTPTECTLRKVNAFIGFKDPPATRLNWLVRPERSGKRYFASRDAGITGFSHVGLSTTNPTRTSSSGPRSATPGSATGSGYRADAGQRHPSHHRAGAGTRTGHSPRQPPS